MLSSRVSRFFLSNVTPPDVTRRELWLNDVLIYVIYFMPATVCEYYLLMSNNLLFVDNVHNNQYRIPKNHENHFLI